MKAERTAHTSHSTAPGVAVALETTGGERSLQTLRDALDLCTTAHESAVAAILDCLTSVERLCSFEADSRVLETRSELRAALHALGAAVFDLHRGDALALSVAPPPDRAGEADPSDDEYRSWDFDESKLADDDDEHGEPPDDHDDGDFDEHDHDGEDFDDDDHGGEDFDADDRDDEDFDGDNRDGEDFDADEEERPLADGSESAGVAGKAAKVAREQQSARVAAPPRHVQPASAAPIDSDRLRQFTQEFRWRRSLGHGPRGVVPMPSDAAQRFLRHALLRVGDCAEATHDSARVRQAISDLEMLVRDDIDSWGELPREVNHALVTLAAAWGRTLQEAADAVGDGSFERRFCSLFGVLGTHSRETQPGVVHGLARAHTPRCGTWRNNLRHAIEAARSLGGIVPPESGSGVDSAGTSEREFRFDEALLRLARDAEEGMSGREFAARALALVEAGLSPRNKRLVRLAQPYLLEIKHPLLARLVEGANALAAGREKGPGGGESGEAAVRGSSATGSDSASPAAPAARSDDAVGGSEERGCDEGEIDGKGTGDGGADGGPIREGENDGSDVDGFAGSDDKPIGAAPIGAAPIEGEAETAPDVDSRSSDDGTPAGTVDPSWPHAAFCRTARVLIVGGEAREKQRAALQRYFGFRELVWIGGAARAPRKVTSVLRRMRSGSVEMIIVLRAWSSHRLTRAIWAEKNGHCRIIQADKYSATQVQLGIDRFLGTHPSR